MKLTLRNLMSDSASVVYERQSAAALPSISAAATVSNQSNSNASSSSTDVVDASIAPTATCSNVADGNRRRFTRDRVELLRRQLDERSGIDLLRLRLDPNANESENKTVEIVLYVPAIHTCTLHYST